MQVSVEVLDGLQRRMRVEIPAEGVDSVVQQRLREYSKQVKLDGFRPGKVPMKVIQKRYGAAMRQEVLGEVVERNYFEALTQEKLMPAGSPSIETEDNEPGKEFAFTATFEVFPDVELAEISSMKLEKVVGTVEDADIDGMLDKLREQRVEYVEVERAAKDGDRVTIDYKGSENGEPIEKAQQEGAEVVVGAGRMIPGFEENFLGAEAGSDVSFDITFPEDYFAEDMAGKTVHFDTKVQSVAEPKLPELDDDFAATLGVTEGGFEAFREQVRNNMVRELEERLRASNKDAVIEALLEAHEVQLPSALVDEEIERLRKAREAQNQTADDGELETEARRRVTLGLLMRELVDVNEIKADSAQVQQRLASIASTFEDPSQVMAMYQKDPQLVQELEAAALEDAVIEWVFGQADVTENARNFDEVMNPSSAS